MASEAESRAARQTLEEFSRSILPTEWDAVRIGDLLSAERGISVGVMYPGENTPSGVPLIRAGELTGNRIAPRPEYRISQSKHDEYRRTELNGGELLVSLVGDVGRCAVVPQQMAGWNVARAIAVLRFAAPEEAAFVRACLLSLPLQHLMGAWATTTVQATLNLKEIRRLPIPWPPASERAAIAEMVRVFDERVDIAIAENRSLEAIVRAIFKSWFVDFDPVLAKGADREPEGMNAETAALFPSDFTEPPHAIPAGWTPTVLGEVCEVSRVGVQKAEMHPDENYVGLEHISRESWSLLSWGTAQDLQSNKSRFQKGDILFGKLRPYFHKVCVAPLAGVCSTDILVLRPKRPGWMAFVLCHASSKELIDYATRLSNGAKMPRSNWGDLSAYKIAIPPVTLAAAFNQIVEPMLGKIITNVHAAATLSAVRDLLLPRLISGKLRVPEAEKLVEAVL